MEEQITKIEQQKPKQHLFEKLDALDFVVDRVNTSYENTKDTGDYVPEKPNKRIHKDIFKVYNGYVKQITPGFFTRLFRAIFRKKNAMLKALAEQGRKRSEGVKEEGKSEQSERIKSDSGLCLPLDTGTSGQPSQHPTDPAIAGAVGVESQKASETDTQPSVTHAPTARGKGGKPARLAPAVVTDGTKE